MSFTKADYNILKRRKAQYKLEELFEAFLATNDKCAELVDHHYASTNSAQTSLQKGAKRWAKNVIIMTRDERVYLVRTDM